MTIQFSDDPLINAAIMRDLEKAGEESEDSK